MRQPNIQLYKFKSSITELPLFLSKIQMGFPSPADDYLEEVLSLDDIGIGNAASTFLGRVTGESLKDICIYEGDIAVIDKSLKPEHRDLVVCAIDGEFNAKILHIDKLQGNQIGHTNLYSGVIDRDDHRISNGHGRVIYFRGKICHIAGYFGWYFKYAALYRRYCSHCPAYIDCHHNQGWLHHPTGYYSGLPFYTVY